MVFNRKYYYYVSFTFSGPYAQGTGSIDLTRTEKIKTFDDLDAIREVIKKKNGWDTVVITYVQRMKG